MNCFMSLGRQSYRHPICAKKKAKRNVLNLWPLWCDSFKKWVYTRSTYTTRFVICYQLSAMWHEHRAFISPFRVVISQKIMTPFFFSFSTKADFLFSVCDSIHYRHTYTAWCWNSSKWAKQRFKAITKTDIQMGALPSASDIRRVIAGLTQFMCEKMLMGFFDKKHVYFILRVNLQSVHGVAVLNWQNYPLFVPLESRSPVGRFYLYPNWTESMSSI